MRKKVIQFILLFISIVALQSEAMANDVAALQADIAALQSQFKEMRTTYEAKIMALETKVEDLQKSYSIKETPQVASAPSHIESLPRTFQSFNPDVSVIGDFVYHNTDSKPTDLRNQFQMRQTELALSAYVDSYAKGDFFFHVEQEDGEWRIGLCEGYMTLLTLPIDGLQMKAGKFKTEIGKANKLHLHSLPWVDYPNVITNFLGGEGMSEPGVSASYLIPNPWDKYLELTGQIVNNRNSASFAGSDGKDLVYIGHLKSSFDINEESTLELGTSLAAGSNTEGHGKFNKNITALEGLDLTYKWRPHREGLYKSVVFQNELLFSQKDRPFYDDGTDIIDGKRIDSWGGYSSLQYQFAKRWSAFTRYDYSEYPDFSMRRENAASLGLTFAQSEYCFWRIQYKHTDRNFDKNSDEVWLQCNFGLGPHRKHEY